MVLVWGLREDSPTGRVLDRLRGIGVPVALIDQQELDRQRIELDEGSCARGALHLPGGPIDLAEIRSAYVRPYDFRRLRVATMLEDSDPRLYEFCAFESALYAWVESAPGIVMNRFSAMASNGSKPLQADVIRRFGFALPETLLTTSPVAAADFRARHRAIVYKSISGQRSIVTRVDEDGSTDFANVERCITQFQEFVPGTDYRVHVVADRIFACRIDSDAVDYRYDHGTRITPVEIPVALAERCYRLTTGRGLVFGGLDLRQTPQGEWYCFEVNPSPGFTYFEDATGIPIAAEVASVLAGTESA
jgi:glutathione synthase/RimK-type ligase-like ATP-grasp enzyme